MCGDVQMYKEDDVSYINFSDYHPVETEGHEAIDLGLPSGLLWATTNIGAEVPEDYGFYFQWGDSEVKTQDNVHETSWTKYKWCDAAPDKLTKYCLSEDYGTVDNKSLLDMEDDAAHVLWNGEWRMPAIEDMQELIDNTTKEWTTINGVTGMKFTSKTIGTSIFLPAAGYGDGAYFGGEGYYWTSSLLYSNDDASSSIANCLYAPVSENVCFLTAYYRSAGFPIRPVHPK